MPQFLVITEDSGVRICRVLREVTVAVVTPNTIDVITTPDNMVPVQDLQLDAKPQDLLRLVRTQR